MPFTRGTFLGSSLRSFNSSIGWGPGSPSTLTVRLVDDPVNGDAFSPGETGEPAYFQFYSFTFAGLIQEWRKNNATDGLPTYEVTLVDPREILEGAQIIIGAYHGSVGGIKNLYNAYGYWESQSFGSSGINEGGMQWSKIKTAVQALANGGSFGAYGGPLAYRGAVYGLDLSQLPPTPSSFRIGGSSISLMDAIVQVCDAAGYDFFVELVGLNIRIRTVSRSSQPPLGTISAIANTNWGGTVVSSTNGVEARNEITSAFLVGGNQARLWLTDAIEQFWGFDINGNLIREGDEELEIKNKDGDVVRTIETKRVPLNAAPVADIVGSTTYGCTHLEMRLAKANFDSWASFIEAYRPQIASRIMPATFKNMGVDLAMKPNMVNDDESFALQAAQNAIQGDLWANSQRLYEFVRGYADEYLGRKFMISLPFMFHHQDAETLQVRTSYEVADGGYLEEGSEPLGLSLLNEDIFKNPDGRMRAFAKYEAISGVDFSSVSPQGSVIEDENLFIEAQVETQIINDPTPHVILTISSPISNQPVDMVGDLSIVSGVFNKDDDDNTKELMEKAYFPHKVAPATRIPDSVAIPLQSNLLTYGPWYLQGAPGKVNYEHDESLTPWNYGGYTEMNLAANARVTESVTNMQLSETGSLELVGAPSFSLGDIMQSGGPNVTNIDVQIGENGVTTTYRFATFTPKFGLFGKSNVERMKRLAHSNQQLRRSMRLAFKQAVARRGVIATADRARRAYMSNAPKQLKKENCPHEVLISYSYEDEGGVRNWVSTATYEESVMLANAHRSNEWKNTAIMSFDGLFRPFSISDMGSGQHLSKVEDASLTGNFPNVDTLNPWKDANDIEVWSWGSQYEGLHAKRRGGDTETVRGLALRGPLWMTGWGMTTEREYVPGDGAAPSSEWSSDYLTNSKNWKTGPVDHLWDDRRGVWTSHDILKGTTKNEIAAGASGIVDIYVGEGSGSVNKWSMYAVNWSDSPIPSGTKAQLGYVATDNLWSVFTGGGCEGRNEIIQLVIYGSPTGGTFDMSLNILGVTETLTFNWDDTATEVQTELETHTNIAPGDVEVTGGPFPNGIINIEFMGDLENTRIQYPSIFHSLTGGAGMAVLPARWQPGHPKDGSVAP